MVARIFFLLCFLLAPTLSFAQELLDVQIVGTWSSKSNKTFTGPGFYDPINERMIEPLITGISYSFTDDGYYESAFYRAVANPSKPACPSAIMQWQHGSYNRFSNGSLILTPIADDGRQLVSEPCKRKSSVYTRWNQTVVFKRYEIVVDRFHKIHRLNLFHADGAPEMPLYIAFRPPLMLPTTTLNPIPTSTAAGGHQASGLNRRYQRATSSGSTHTKHPLLRRSFWKRQVQSINPNYWCWAGVAITGFGSVLVFLVGPRLTGS